jgi:hypothetical protein
MQWRVADTAAMHYDVSDNVAIDLIEAVNRRDLALPLDPYRNCRIPHTLLTSVAGNIAQSLIEIELAHEGALLAELGLSGFPEWARPMLRKRLEADPLWLDLKGVRSVISTAAERRSDVEVAGK